MTNEEFYNKVASGEMHLSYSSICALMKSPRHFINRYTAEKNQTAAMSFGSAFHCLVLEPKEFKNRYIIEPSFNKRTKAGKEAYSEFLESIGDKLTISQGDYNTAVDMSNAIFDNSALEPLLYGEKEKQFNIEYNGVKLRGIWDVHSDFAGVTDLKTCADANPKAFAKKAIWEFHYYLQGAIYTLENNTSFTIIAVDRNCFTSVITFSDDAIKRGLMLLAKYIENYKVLQQETIKGNVKVWNQGYEYWYPDGYEINF